MATKTKMVATKATNTSVMEAGVEPQPPGPGCLVRSSCITDSWGMRPRLEQDPTFRRTLVRRTLDWYGLVYVHRGSGTFDDPHGSRPVRAGDLVCLFPCVPHAYGPDSDKRWDAINIDFSGPAFAAWQGPGILDPDEPIRRLEPIGAARRRRCDRRRGPGATRGPRRGRRRARPLRAWYDG